MPFRFKLLALLVVLFWALNVIVIKLGVADIPPILMSALRFTLVAALLVPFTRIRRDQWKGVVLVSVTFGTLHFGVLFLALERAEAGTSAILIQLGAPIATVLACFVLKERLGPMRLLGLAVSVAGIAVLAVGPTMPSPLPFALLMISATAWAVTNLIIKSIPGISPMTMMGWSSLFAVPQVLTASWLLEGERWFTANYASPWGWIAVIYSAIASSIVAYGIWYWLLQRYPINSVVPFSMLNPLLTVLLGIVLLGDAPSPVKIAGALVMLVGVALILRRPVTAPTLPDTA
ncbi:EamA family transporter [Ancylobacter sp. A5.8]|uniref:DMT family transporter n=1 Tax=Ancylobacter gelatini TaxID=2919920 RepID=UPI001F4D42C5|nr:EamA family transporter [Ancylobacter gelatini]MCJ8143229.1 EamA family transporter [Ancylobacter gelatini]